jgi:hypothetical protein
MVYVTEWGQWSEMRTWNFLKPKMEWYEVILTLWNNGKWGSTNRRGLQKLAIERSEPDRESH